MNVTVKQAKTIPLLKLSICVLCLVGVLIAIGITINGIVNPSELSDLIFWWIFLVIGLIVIALDMGAIVEICIIITETYTFTDDKLIKKYKNEVKFEIPYSNIDTFEIDKLFIIRGWAMSIHSTEPFVKYGLNKYLKRVDGYFKKDDLDKIKERITAYNAENGDSIKVIEKINFFD